MVTGCNTTQPAPNFYNKYHVLLEAAFEREGVPFFDGFVGSEQPFLDTATIETDDLPARWTRIIKLHGSSNWAVRDNQSVVRVPVHASKDRRLIHPSHLKYAESRRMPYLMMFDQLRDFIKFPSATLVSVGYSFGDGHINDLMAQGLRANTSAKIFGLQYGELDTYDEAKKLATQNLGVTVIARNGGIDAGRQFSLESATDQKVSTFNWGDFRDFGNHLRRSVGNATDSAGLSADQVGDSDEK